MKIRIAIIFLLVIAFQTSEAQIGRFKLSPLQESTITIASTEIAITYSRPSMRGREIFGGLVPYNAWWRTGANRNTTIEFNESVIIDGQRIPKGKYALFTKPSPTTWDILFYKKTDYWDVPKEMDSTLVAATITVNSEKVQTPLEVLSIQVGDFTNYEFDLNIAWDKTLVKVPIQLITEEIMEKRISRTFGKPVPHDYYSAALYEVESGGNHARGLEWIESAIQLREKTIWWDLRVKAILLKELNRPTEALKVAQRALEMANDEKNEYGMKEMKRIVDELKK